MSYLQVLGGEYLTLTLLPVKQNPEAKYPEKNYLFLTSQSLR